MSTSKAIKPKRDDAPIPHWESMPERAPSIEREEGPLIGRVMAMIGLFLLVLGTLAMLAPYWQRVTVISPGTGFFFASLGGALLLYHAYVERDDQFRRLYAFLGLALILGAIFARLLAFRSGPAADPDRFIRLYSIGGWSGFFVGLLTVIGVLKHETEPKFRSILLNVVGLVGALQVLFGIFRGATGSDDFALVESIGLLVFGLLYVSAFIGLQDSLSDTGYKAGLALGAAGAVGFVIGLVFSIIPAATISARIPTANFFVPSGLILMGMSLLYIGIALAVCVDWPIIVLARRELASYFFSPVAYLVLIGQLVFALIMFTFFVGDLTNSSRDPRRGGLPEPIIIHYVVNIIPVFVMMFFVPAITMRLVSEEKRSGTLEVLLTAPVNEISIVLGKFFAAWIAYLLLWLPWWLFLVSLRYFGNEDFDYRPVLSFMVAQLVISAGFVSMGLFCSSLTNNQIIAAVFTFVGMMAHLVLFFAQQMPWFAGNALGEMLNYVNFVDLWIESLRGTIAPRFLIFHTSVAVFFLFATIKVLESRKWK